MAKVTLNHDYQVQRYGWNCGPTSTRCALSTRGVLVSQDAIIADINSRIPAGSRVDDDGTDYVDLLLPTLRAKSKVQYFTRYIKSGNPPTATIDLLWSDMRASIAAGYGCVANIVADPGISPPGYPNYRIWHYIAIVGFDDAGRKLLVADSANFSGINHYWLPVTQLARLIGNQGKGYAVAPGVADLSADQVNAFTAAFMGPVGSDSKDVRQQLTGGRDGGEYQGWPQLGGRTVTDAIAAILEALNAH